jgi:hypothetical protein
LQIAEGHLGAGVDLVKSDADPKVNTFGVFDPIAGITTSKGRQAARRSASSTGRRTEGHARILRSRAHWRE